MKVVAEDFRSLHKTGATVIHNNHNIEIYKAYEVSKLNLKREDIEKIVSNKHRSSDTAQHFFDVTDTISRLR